MLSVVFFSIKLMMRQRLGNIRQHTLIISNPMSQITTIKLTKKQYAIYKETQLEIQAPNGDVLVEIGTFNEEETQHNKICRLYEQVALLSCVLQGVNEPIRLSIPAVMGLSELLYQLEDVIEQSKKGK